MNRHARLACAAALVPLAACVRSSGTAPLAGPAPITRATLAPYIDSLAGQPMFRNAHWGILIVDPVAGDTLYARNADKLFMPASNMKLVTGAVALDRLGPDYRFTTVFAANGPIRDSVLHGDLLIAGTGDPTVSDAMHEDDALAPLVQIADSLRARGIARIAGRLVAAGDAFPDPAYGFGWGWDDFDFPYSAGVDELFFNEGFATIRVIAARSAGDSTIVETLPLRGYPAVSVRLTPSDPALSNGAARRPRPRAELDSATGGVLITGPLAPGDTFTTRMAFRDQQRAYLEAARQAFAARGVIVEGADLSGAGADTLFTFASPPLREIMPVFEKPSQNQIGEILFKTIAREATGVGTADSARRVVERHLAAWGVDTMGFVIRDGSGLSRHDYLSPRAIVQLLDVMRRHAHFESFYDALPIAGVDGTIANRMRDTPAQGNLHAKTGTLDKARSLSGYVTTADGRLLLFSALANNYTAPLAEVTRVQDQIGARLAELRLDVP